MTAADRESRIVLFPQRSRFLGHFAEISSAFRRHRGVHSGARKELQPQILTDKRLRRDDFFSFSSAGKSFRQTVPKHWIPLPIGDPRVKGVILADLRTVFLRNKNAFRSLCIVPEQLPVKRTLPNLLPQPPNFLFVF